MRKTTDCAWIESQLAGFAAGELDPREVAEVERHLATCPDCRGELAGELALRESLTSLPVVSCPERVTANILAVVNASDRRLGAARRRVVPIGWRRATWGLAAAAVVLALVFVAPWRDRPEDTYVAGEDGWSEQEIRTARGEVRLTLALAARIIEKTERKTVTEVFGRQLRGAVIKSMKALTSSLEGGQG